MLMPVGYELALLPNNWSRPKSSHLRWRQMFLNGFLQVLPKILRVQMMLTAVERLQPSCCLWHCCNRIQSQTHSFWNVDPKRLREPEWCCSRHWSVSSCPLTASLAVLWPAHFSKLAVSCCMLLSTTNQHDDLRCCNCILSAYLHHYRIKRLENNRYFFQRLPFFCRQTHHRIHENRCCCIKRLLYFTHFLTHMKSWIPLCHQVILQLQSCSVGSYLFLQLLEFCSCNINKIPSYSDGNIYLLLKSYIKHIKSYTQLYSRQIGNSIHKLITWEQTQRGVFMFNIQQL